ncbi:hypothetical protein E2P81_ATG07536 [Venturia nashicola]|nr:hypothetical protein E2P81_ATG07536 [Venturia nashicola]
MPKSPHFQRPTKDPKLPTFPNNPFSTAFAIRNLLPRPLQMRHDSLHIPFLFPNLNHLLAGQTYIINHDIAIVVPHAHPSVILEIQSISVL